MLKTWGRPQSSHVSLDPLGWSLVEGGREHYCAKMAEAWAWHESIPEESFTEQSVQRLGEQDPLEFPVVMSSISRTASNKAAGVDGLPAEVYKTGRFGAASMVHKLLKACLGLGTVPEEWYHGLVHPIYKGMGSQDDFGHTRHITVVPVIRKIIERCILGSIERKAGTLTIIYQGGFREGRGTVDQCLALDALLQSGKRVVAYLVIFRAYDGVCRQLLWARCQRRGLSDRLLRLCQPHERPRSVPGGGNVRGGVWRAARIRPRPTSVLNIHR